MRAYHAAASRQRAAACCGGRALSRNATAPASFSRSGHPTPHSRTQHAWTQESDAFGGPALLPAGIAGSRAAGEAFRRRYLQHPDCTAAGNGGNGSSTAATRAATRTAGTNTCLSVEGAEGYGLLGSRGAGFTNYNLLARSSGLDRTLSTAAAFLSAAFPATPSAGAAAAATDGNSGSGGAASAGRAPPVYSAPDADDWAVRAYTKCPAYEARLRAWLASDAGFAAKERATAALREGIGALQEGLDVSLANWWNGARGGGRGGTVCLGLSPSASLLLLPLGAWRCALINNHPKHLSTPIFPKRSLRRAQRLEQVRRRRPGAQRDGGAAQGGESGGSLCAL